MIDLYQLPSIKTERRIIAKRLSEPPLTADFPEKSAKKELTPFRAEIMEILSDGIPRSTYEVADLLPQYNSASVAKAMYILRAAGKLCNRGFRGNKNLWTVTGNKDLQFDD